MRKTFSAILLALFSTAVSAQTRGLAISDVTMTTSDDSVALEMKLAVSPDAVTSLQGMEVVPVLTGSAEEAVRFPGVVVNGRNRARIYARHAKFRYDEIVGNPPYVVVNLDRKFTGDTISYSARRAVATWMENASLSLEFVLVSPAGERQAYTVPVSGVSTIAASPEPAAEPVAMQVFSGETVAAEPKPTEMVSMRSVSGSAFLDFAAASHTLTLSSELNRRELGKVDETIGRIVTTGGIVSVTITGYSSPDGYYDTNASLAHDRGVAFSRWLQDRYGLPDEIIKIRTAGENWNDLRAAVAGTEMPYRDEILSIIDSADSPDAKESRLRRMGSGEVWSMLERDIFPGLRKVDYSVDYRLAK